MKMRQHLAFSSLSAPWSVLLLVAVTSWAPSISSAWITPSTRAITRSRESLRQTTVKRGILYAVSSDEEKEVSNPLNPLVASVKPSKTVEIFSLVKQMEADGIEVTSLCVGEPDFLPPQQVLDAAIKAVQDGQTRYTALTGTIELRKAIAEDLKRRKKVTYNSLNEIIVGNGAKQCVYQGLLALCGTGDSVIIPAPYWPSYPEMAALAGATAITIPTKPENGYLMTPAELRTALEEHSKDHNVKMIILCNPSNPTGGVYDRNALAALAKVLEDFPDVFVLADEIYERLVYSDDEDVNKNVDTADACPSFASIDGMFHRTLTVNGFSKAYAMTGMRLGYIAAPAHIAKAITTIQSQFTSCAGSISQAAGVAALTQVPDEVLDKNVLIMKEKRDYVLKELSQMPNVHVDVPPRGAFYVMPDVSAYNNGDDTDLCLRLLKSKKLALVPGSSFGAPGTVRISYATSMKELQLAMQKLREFLEEQ